MVSVTRNVSSGYIVACVALLVSRIPVNTNHSSKMKGETEMRYWIAGIVGFLVLATAGMVIVLTHVQGEVNVNRADVVRANALMARLKGSVSQIAARANGAHRDLITCGDLQSMINDGYVSSYYVDSNNTLQSSPAGLPGHCVNR